MFWKFSVPSFQCFPFCKIMFFYACYNLETFWVFIYTYFNFTWEFSKLMIKERFTESYQSYINQSYQIYIENTIFFEKLTVLILKKQPPEVFCKKKCSYRNITKFTGEHLCQSFFFNKVTGRGPLEQVFSCEFCEISKKTFFTEHLWATASNISNFVVHEK